MLTDAQIEGAARRLALAETERRQIRQFSLEFPGMTIEDAYAIQRAFVALKVSEGRTIKGHKIGLTSRAMQLAVSIDEPDYGVLFDDMFFQDGGRVPTDRFIGLRIEAELAFVLKAPIRGPDCTIFDVYNATDYVVPALEILDARVQRVDPDTEVTRKIVDTISDNAANAGIVLGGRPFRPESVDMRWVGAICSRNGQIEETGLAAGVLNHPANGIVWLAKRLAPHGAGLEAGQVVLAGSFVRPIDVKRGDTFQADYGPLGTVGCYFA